MAAEAPILAVGLISGGVELHSVSWSKPTSVDAVFRCRLAAHAPQQSCRAARFLPDASAIVSGGLDCALVLSDVESGRQVGGLMAGLHQRELGYSS
jgi:hypothetical protein